MWVSRELAYALAQRKYVGKIVPVLLHKCDHETLSWTLTTLQMIGFTRGFTKGCRDLLRIWGLSYQS